MTRWLSPWCTVVALGFEDASTRLPKASSVSVGTPVRTQFLTHPPPPLPEIDLPTEAPLIVVVGGSQGAVAVNRLVRSAVPAWLATGAWIIHQTGQNDPEGDSLNHPHYIHRPFFDEMAPILHRANLVISRAGAGTLTELAVTRSPSLLIPYPFAAEDHQSYNAAVFAAAGAAQVCRQADLNADSLQEKVLGLLRDRDQLNTMAEAAGNLAITDSAEQLANLVRKTLDKSIDKSTIN